ncbi:MAG TPA: chloride channel protein, partial [Polyangiaceae bacterium]|nr:chloride channel protein [Polyangiaceae bacterium]
APRMALIAFVSILFGGSAGPEAPLVQVIGSLGSALGDRLRLSNDEVRILTLSGMAAALGAFFGAPLAGAVFALELPHQRGLEFFEALMPAVLSASVAFVVFDAFVPVSHPLLHFGSDLSIAYGSAVPFAILLGALGAAIGACFQIAFDGLGSVTRRFDERPVLLATCGGALLGAIALLTPRATGMTTLFWGEPQLVHFSTQLASGNVTNLGRVALPWLALAALELLSISITLRSGFRGGFIFPLLFVGALVGAAAHALSGGRIPLPVAVMCTMVAVNVAVTKTPLGTAILLGTLSGTALLPLILVASLTSFFLAGPVRVIRSQRSRTEPDHVERTEPRRHTASTALLAEQAARAGLPPT